MRFVRAGTLASTVAFLVMVAGCASRGPLPSGAVAVPTDDALVSSAQSNILCTASAAIPPVVGILAGDASESAWPVWLRAEDGQRMYVVWPKGFSARFDPGVTLLDETGAPVLDEGSPITLVQVARDPSRGTRERPYVAEGLWETGLAGAPRCYNHTG
jgi:hypothetical protein